MDDASIQSNLEQRQQEKLPIHTRIVNIFASWTREGMDDESTQVLKRHSISKQNYHTIPHVYCKTRDERERI